MAILDGGGSATDRVQALSDLRILDTPAEPSFDALVHLAAQICDAPIALISLLDRDRLWLKAETGLGLRELPARGTPCALVAQGSRPLVIPDLQSEPQLNFLPVACGPPRARFYAGVPLQTGGIAIGALCVIDPTARRNGLTTRQMQSLQMLADQVMTQLGLRRELYRREHEDRSRLALLVNQAVIGIVQSDLDGRTTLVNDRYCALLGRSREDTLTLPGLAAVHSEDRQKYRDLLDRMLVSGETITLESWIGRPDTSVVWVKIYCSLLRDPSGLPTHIISIVQDVTAERAARNALWEIAESLDQRVTDEVSQRMTIEHALHQAQKMEAVGSLSGGLAHDFNNMLAGMIANLELLEGRLGKGDTADARRYLGTALAAADRAAAVAKRLLAFSRKQELAPRATEVSALVASMLLLVRHTVGARIVVESALAEDLEPTLCDPSQLESALLNLVINARDSIAEGGRITINTVGLTIRPQDSTAWGDVAPGRYVALSVSDTGAGMVTDVVARAFEPFFTTKPAHQGTGMGLFMLHSFARQARGHVRVHSVPGAGTTVELCLPCLHSEAPQGAPQGAAGLLPAQLVASAGD